MPTRRRFLGTIVGGAAGTWLCGQPLLAQNERRRVTIGGRPITVVDIHAHCVIPVTDIVRGSALSNAGGASAASGLLLGPERLQLMDRTGVDMQALTINGFWWYGAERDLARAIVSAQNEGLAKWVAQHPDRFVALASVALQYPDLAAEQLEEGVKRLGLRGAAIGGHVNGEMLSLPKYDAFWSKAAELGVLVFMHPNNAQNLIKTGTLSGRGGLDNIIGNPLETTHFLSRLIYDGVFDKFPALKVGAAHGGGYLPSYLGRTEVNCGRGNSNCGNAAKPSAYMRSQIVADTMVFSEEGLRHLVAEMGATQVVYGTDVPYDWPVTVDLIANASFLSNADKEAILGGNLKRLLRL